MNYELASSLDITPYIASQPNKNLRVLRAVAYPDCMAIAEISSFAKLCEYETMLDGILSVLEQDLEKMFLLIAIDVDQEELTSYIRKFKPKNILLIGEGLPDISKYKTSSMELMTNNLNLKKTAYKTLLALKKKLAR